MRLQELRLQPKLENGMPKEVKQKRGDYYGITNAKALSRTTKAKLLGVRARIEKMAEPWAEADPMIESATQTALDAIDNLIKQYQDSAEYMNETMDD